MKVGICGAGTMGQGIAQTFLLNGYEVVLYDAFPNAIYNARQNIAKAFEKVVAKGKVPAAVIEKSITYLSSVPILDGLKDCDLIIEAALEIPSLKADIFKKLDEVCPVYTILASNTSSISLTQIAASCKHPERVVGMHFFNPVPVMALVEIIPALQTSEEVVKSVKKVAEDVGKTAVVVKDSAGFAVNRVLIPMINEAILLLQEGVCTAADIDTAMKLGCNHPIGPLALADMIGLDICLNVMEVLYANLEDSKYRAAPLLKKMVAAKYLGRKTSKGFFDYNK